MEVVIGFFVPLMLFPFAVAVAATGDEEDDVAEEHFLAVENYVGRGVVDGADGGGCWILAPPSRRLN